jgi:hypothetical protein
MQVEPGRSLTSLRERCNWIATQIRRMCLILFTFYVTTLIASSEAGGRDGRGVSVRRQNDAWALRSTKGAGPTCTIKRYATETSESGSVSASYRIEGKLPYDSLLYQAIREFSFSTSVSGVLRRVSCVLEDSSPPRVATFLNSDRGRDVLRSSLFKLLLSCGELAGEPQEVGHSIHSMSALDFELRAKVLGHDGAGEVVAFPMAGDFRVVSGGMLGGARCIEIHPSLALREMSIKTCVWLVDDPEDISGAIVTCTTSGRRFGSEFDGVYSSSMIVNANDEHRNRASSKLNLLLATIQPVQPEFDRAELLDEDAYMDEPWSWSVRVGESCEAQRDIGTLSMGVLKRSGTSLHNWRHDLEFTFSGTESSGTGETSAFGMLPQTIKCSRNEARQINHIELLYASRPDVVGGPARLDSSARLCLGILISSGIWDSRVDKARSLCGLPVGAQPFPISEDAIIELRSAHDNTLLLQRSPGELGFSPALDSGIPWSRSLALDPCFPYTFTARFSYDGDRSPMSAELLRAGYALGSGAVFGASPVTRYALRDDSTGACSLQYWLIRTVPEPGYFVKRRKSRVERMQAAGPRRKDFVRAASVADQLNVLLGWLPVEDAGRVFRALYSVNDAKTRWAQRVGADTSRTLDWDDIAPFLETARKDLPRPKGGIYVLGESLSVPPRFSPKD